LTKGPNKFYFIFISYFHLLVKWFSIYFSNFKSNAILKITLLLIYFFFLKSTTIAFSLSNSKLASVLSIWTGLYSSFSSTKFICLGSNFCFASSSPPSVATPGTNLEKL